MNNKSLHNIFAGVMVFGILIFVSSLSWAKSPAQESSPNLQSSEHSKAFKKERLTDQDNDGLSDGLQEKLDTISPSELVDVIVTFKGPGNAQSAQTAVGLFNVKRKFKIINGFSATMRAAQAKALAKVPGVFRVEENVMVHAMLDAANRDFGTEAARTDFSVTGYEIGICVVDTGVDPYHEQLDDGKVVAFIDYSQDQYPDGIETNPYDDHGHGTHVSSIAAGDGVGGSNASQFKGVAPGAKIYAAKVLDSSGSGPDDDVIAGVEWCAAIEDVDIISMSLGTEGASDGEDILSRAVNAAVSAGKIVVVAAGNSGSGTYTVGSPGAASDVITVGAAAEWSAPENSTNHSDGVYLAPFSSRGPTLDERIKPDITAPGVSITAARYNSNNGYITYSGTSMATPFVSGTVALALEAAGSNSLTPTDVKQNIMSTAKKIRPQDPDNDWGAGLIDGYRLVSEIKRQPASNFYPTLEHIVGSVSDNGSWQFSFGVDDPNVPVAVMMTIECDASAPSECPYDDPLLCAIWELGQLGFSGCTPDLDMELWGPDGFLAESTCMVGDECANYGRQETVHVGTPAVGTYTIYVYPYGGAPNNGQGGNFTIDISTGPVDSGCSEDDSDCDGVPDGDDGCLNDPNKIEPGICGCGVAEGECQSNCTACFKGKCDGVCHPQEVGTNCPDCSASSTETNCSDGEDNDLDGFIDCEDSDCNNDSLCSPSQCLDQGESCNSKDECCSNKCVQGTCK